MYLRRSYYLLKTTSIVLSIGLLVSIGFLYKIYDENKNTKEALILEKTIIINELKKTKQNLEIAINDNISSKAELLIEREKVSVLLNEINKENIDMAAILKYKKEVKRLNDVVSHLNKQNKLLIKSNLAYKTQRDSTILILGNAQKYRDSLVAMNENLNSKIIRSGAIISVVDLKIKPLELKKKNEISMTDKADKTNKIRVAFTITGNKIANATIKRYYIQIIDSENKVVGEGKHKDFGNTILYYSDIVEVRYQNRSLDIHRDILSSKFKKGIYFANIFDKDELVSKTSFNLR